MTICEWDKAVAKTYGAVPQVLEGKRRHSHVWANRDGEKVVRNGKKCLLGPVVYRTK
jgi:hypothetical protein